MNKRKTIALLFFLSLFISCVSSYESQDREKLISSFEDNFGFKPPDSVKEINLKNWGLYDTTVQWMAFTYDLNTFKKVTIHDQPLNIALNNTSEFYAIIEEIQKSVNNPDWLDLPNKDTNQIYYKKDFLDHTFSEYYLWTNKETKMTFLFVHYFD